jgi:hypothetical protein
MCVRQCYFKAVIVREHVSGEGIEKHGKQCSNGLDVFEGCASDCISVSQSAQPASQKTRSRAQSPST